MINSSGGPSNTPSDCFVFEAIRQWKRGDLRQGGSNLGEIGMDVHKKLRSTDVWNGVFDVRIRRVDYSTDAMVFRTRPMIW